MPAGIVSLVGNNVGFLDLCEQDSCDSCDIGCDYTVVLSPNS